MVVIDAVTPKHPEPRRALHVLAAVFVPGDVELGLFVVAQHFRLHEGADVQAYAVVQVRVPADGLFGQALPAHKDVVRRFAFQNQLQAALEVLCGGQAGGRTIHALAHAGFLLANPVTQVGVDEALQLFVVELVVVDQRGKAVFEAVPHMPDEGAVVEALGVLLEEFFAQPHIQALAGAVGPGQQLVEDGGAPAAGLHGFPGCNQQLQQALVRRGLAAHRGQAADAVVVGVRLQRGAARNPGVRRFGQLHGRALGGGGGDVFAIN